MFLVTKKVWSHPGCVRINHPVMLGMTARQGMITGNIRVMNGNNYTACV